MPQKILLAALLISAATAVAQEKEVPVAPAEPRKEKAQKAPVAPAEQRKEKVQKAPAAPAKPPKEKAEKAPPAQAKKEKPERKEEKPIPFNPEWVKALAWRSIGPASMGGRIVDVEVVESDPFTFYVATASGGLFKTTNNGTTFSAVFDKENTVSIGDVAVSYSDPNVVWVGTGEHNARNSVSWGDGVYRSTDGGKTWQHKGLEKSFQIGRIAIHPTNPDVVYVGA
ncbi:MAG: WD40/YVTN/BNR-like repeat-containing protein, partial [Planctomycetota bacterium]